jgi:hypothetical protein
MSQLTVSIDTAQTRVRQKDQNKTFSQQPNSTRELYELIRNRRDTSGYYERSRQEFFTRIQRMNEIATTSTRTEPYLQKTVAFQLRF